MKCRHANTRRHSSSPRKTTIKHSFYLILENSRRLPPPAVWFISAFLVLLMRAVPSSQNPIATFPHNAFPHNSKQPEMRQSVSPPPLKKKTARIPLCSLHSTRNRSGFLQLLSQPPHLHFPPFASRLLSGRSSRKQQNSRSIQKNRALLQKPFHYSLSYNIFPLTLAALCEKSINLNNKKMVEKIHQTLRGLQSSPLDCPCRRFVYNAVRLFHDRCHGSSGRHINEKYRRRRFRLDGNRIRYFHRSLRLV